MDKHYVIELLEDVDLRMNDRSYCKGDRLVVWLGERGYRVANNKMDFIPLERGRQIYKILFEKIQRKGELI